MAGYRCLLICWMTWLVPTSFETMKNSYRKTIIVRRSPLINCRTRPTLIRGCCFIMVLKYVAKMPRDCLDDVLATRTYFRCSVSMPFTVLLPPQGVHVNSLDLLCSTTTRICNRWCDLEGKTQKQCKWHTAGGRVCALSKVATCSLRVLILSKSIKIRRSADDRLNSDSGVKLGLNAWTNGDQQTWHAPKPHVFNCSCDCTLAGDGLLLLRAGLRLLILRGLRLLLLLLRMPLLRGEGLRRSARWVKLGRSRTELKRDGCERQTCEIIGDDKLMHQLSSEYKQEFCLKQWTHMYESLHTHAYLHLFHGKYQRYHVG
jgi:hypothetical protein